MKSEFEFLQFLKKNVPSPLKGIGIGDDAAVLECSKNKKIVFSTDVLVDQVHFDRKKDKPELMGRKSLAVNLSDIAAMGASPKYFTISLGITPQTHAGWLKAYYRGLLRLAKKWNVACVGGDVSQAKTFFASIAILGEVEKKKAVLRKGARPGDAVCVTGKLGGSLLEHHLKFAPRIVEGQFLSNRKVSSMMDISDGLSKDLIHLTVSSQVVAEIDLDKIPMSFSALKKARKSKTKALRFALSDGEDFELLFTIAPKQLKVLEREWKNKFPRVALSKIGVIKKGKPGIRWIQDLRRVHPHKLMPKGFDHFQL